MSRHPFEHDGSSWVVGWDEPTSTYFAQRENDDQDLDDVTGTSVGQHTQVASLVDELRDQVTVPEDVRAQLEAEAPTFTAASLERAQTRANELRAELAAELHRAAQRPQRQAASTTGHER